MRRTVIKPSPIRENKSSTPIIVLGDEKCGGEEKKGCSRIRFLHDAPAGPKLDIYISDRLTTESINYKNITDYIRVKSGTYDIICAPPGPQRGNIEGILAKSCILKEGVDYLFVIHNIACTGEIDATMLESEIKCPDVGVSYIRLFHTASGLPSVDVIINNSGKLFTGVPYGKLSNPQYMAVGSGVKQLSVIPTHSNQIILGPITVQLESRKIYTLVLSGVLSNPQTPLSAIFIEDTNEMSINYCAGLVEILEE